MVAEWFPAAAADFINSELWSSAVTVEMNGKGSLTSDGGGRKEGRKRRIERAGCRDGEDAITVLLSG